MFMFQTYFHNIQGGRGWMRTIQMGIKNTARLVQVRCYPTRTGLPENQVAATSAAISVQAQDDGMTYPVANLYLPYVNMISSKNSGFARYLNDGEMKHWAKHHVAYFLACKHRIENLLINHFCA